MTPLSPPPQDGQPGAERGFWGDVVTGPFLIFGLTPSGTHEKVGGGGTVYFGGRRGGGGNICDGVVFTL